MIPPSHLASRTQDVAKQRLRLQRFLLASTFSVVYVVVLAVFHVYGRLDRDTLVAASWVVGVLIIAFFGAFRLGLNLRCPDPSLTGLQILAAVFSMLFVFYRAPDTRLIFAAFFFVALMFGMLRSSGKQLTLLGCIALSSFAVVSVGRYLLTADADVLRLDMLQLIAIATAFPWFVFIGGRVKRLKEADRRKDDFLATLAHELRNPLAPIRTGVKILGMTHHQPSAQTVLPMMERQLQHITRLLDDLLDVSRITRGKIALHLERTDLAQAVQAAVEATGPLMDEMGHQLAISLPPQPVALDADPVRLAQILSNLLNNAAKYTPRGGRIELRAECRGGSVEVSVADNGIGIPSDRLSSIFDMFAQVEVAAPHAQGGLGVGLALVKGLVTLHHGSIEARSDGPGRGSEFRFRLPTRIAGAALPITPARPESARTKMRILVVDDNRDAADSLSMLLELMGHEVRVAHDGETAVRLAAEFRPAVALLDLGMPFVSGYQVCQRIRAQPWGEGMRLIAVTGWGQDEDRYRSSVAGFDAHLVKPVNPETLERALAGDHATVESTLT